MNIDHITPSVLHVIAKENIDIQKDLSLEDGKAISELLEKNTNERKEKDNQSTKK